ncbi:Rap1a/Tai family immunity protein, partial [Pseudomonas sp. PA-1-2A]|uniref:Rap1a/Tai family immunity protein n=3 Tax=Pseudomonas TaxID=286 RepID=UPI001F4660A8
ICLICCNDGYWDCRRNSQRGLCVIPAFLATNRRAASAWVFRVVLLYMLVFSPNQRGIDMRVLMAAVTIIGLLASNAVFAENNAGTRFLSGCKVALRFFETKHMAADENQVDMGYCVGVVAGVRETLQYLTGGAVNKFPGICLPENYVDQMGVQAIVKHSEGRSDLSTKRPTLTVLLALKAEYPCK